VPQGVVEDGPEAPHLPGGRLLEEVSRDGEGAVAEPRPLDGALPRLGPLPPSSCATSTPGRLSVMASS
jgi:hypothetical protein